MVTMTRDTCESDIREDTDVMHQFGTIETEDNEANTHYGAGKLSKVQAATTRKAKCCKRRWWIAGAVITVLLCVGLSLVTALVIFPLTMPQVRAPSKYINEVQGLSTTFTTLAEDKMKAEPMDEDSHMLTEFDIFHVNEVQGPSTTFTNLAKDKIEAEPMDEDSHMLTEFDIFHVYEVQAPSTTFTNLAEDKIKAEPMDEDSHVLTELELRERATLEKADILKLLSNKQFVGKTINGGQDCAYGAFHGFLECTNIVCKPIKLTGDIAEVIQNVSSHISNAVNALKLFKTFLKPLGQLPYVGIVTTPLQTFLTRIVPKMNKVNKFLQTNIDPPLNKYLNGTDQIGKDCNRTEFAAMLSNTIATVSDSEVGTNLLADLKTVADAAEGLCKSTILSDTFPKSPQWCQLLVSAENDKKKQGKKRNVPGCSTTLASDSSSETKSLMKILKLMDPIQANFERLDGPFLEAIQHVKEKVDDVLNKELCIPLGPFGDILGTIYNLDQNSTAIIIEASIDIATGKLGDAAELLMDVFGEVGNRFENIWTSAGQSLSDLNGFLYNLYGRLGNYFGKRRRKRTVSNEESGRELSADDVSILGEQFIKNGSDNLQVCISLNDVIGTTSFLLAPFGALVEQLLKPVIDEVMNEMLKDIITNMDFLDELLPVLETLKPGVGIPSFANFSSYVDLVVENDIVAAMMVGEDLIDPQCISTLFDFTRLDNNGSLDEVNSACFFAGMEGKTGVVFTQYANKLQSASLGKVSLEHLVFTKHCPAKQIAKHRNVL